MPSILKVVGAAVLEDGACLVTQRGPAASSEALKWEFPGGKVEAAETPRAALRREIREELHLEIEVGSWLGRGDHADGRRRIELDVYTARIVSGEIQLREHHRYGWFRAHELDDLDWAAADRPVLPALKALLAASRGNATRNCSNSSI